jgi:hypothetical protein
VECLHDPGGGEQGKQPCNPKRDAAEHIGQPPAAEVDAGQANQRHEAGRDRPHGDLAVQRVVAAAS